MNDDHALSNLLMPQFPYLQSRVNHSSCGVEEVGGIKFTQNTLGRALHIEKLPQ